MIHFDDVSVTFDGEEWPTLSRVTLTVAEGDLCLVVGPTGSGKSTLLGAAAGLVPHFTGGHLSGTVLIGGRDTRDHPPHALADLVGVVGQNPAAGFVTGTVEEELAFTMEQLGVAPSVMRQRVEETLDLLGLADLRGRRLDHLSGGQQQRVAIGAVLTAHPRVLVLDEPTSALDPTAAEEVLGMVSRLVSDLGVTALVAEHRLERIVQFADQVAELDGAPDPGRPGTAAGRQVSRVRCGATADVLVDAAVAPPIVELGRVAGWHPVPLTIRDARRRAGSLRDRLAGLERPDDRAGPGGASPRVQDARSDRQPVLRASGVTVRYGDAVAVGGVSVSVAPASITGLMGRNGAGKTSLLWALHGAGPRQAGTVEIAGVDPRTAGAAERRGLIALVPQQPGDLLYEDTVAAACASADDRAGATAGSCRALLDRLVPGVPAEAHPRDLSEGQRLAVALAIQLLGDPAVVALDEPTRGLDYAAKRQLAAIVRGLTARGVTVLVSTHDVEFVASLCDRVIVMADGEVIADGPTAAVVTASPAFAPQVTKVLAPQPWLTVEEVRDALARSQPTGAPTLPTGTPTLATDTTSPAGGSPDGTASPDRAPRSRPTPSPWPAPTAGVRR
ncbi:ABC transporter ATP-binding protein [Euzebya tangerina]|uniref:ABC transporter ATP-binding protein n=1 Tax=Euzebya tangerina TaxID=591198 RepID=UPI000E3183E9|nr:ABC transporter ATP-binding protein [Euzebya tangerina]